MTKRKELLPWQIEDAARLKTLWDAYKERTGISQEKFAAENDLGTQANLWQYTSGYIPLNLEAAIRFSNGLGVRVSKISPTLALLLKLVQPEPEISKAERPKAISRGARPPNRQPEKRPAFRRKPK